MTYAVVKKNDELYHHGVLGMKWGIRRNSRVLANHRRNDAVRSIKNDYDLGKITKDKKRSLIKIENKKKLDFIKKDYKYSRTTKDEGALRKRYNAVAKETQSEVKGARLKKDLRAINVGAMGLGVTKIGAATVSLALGNPLLAGAVLTSGAINTAATVGLSKLVQYGLNKAS